MSGYIFWFGILGPSDDDDLERTIVLSSWTSPVQKVKMSDLDATAIAALHRTPFAAEDETRVAVVGKGLKIVELKPKGASVSFAAIGEDELELEEFLQSLAGCAARVLDFEAPKSITKSSVRAGLAKLMALADEMVSQGRIDHLEGDAAQKHVKLMLSTTPTKGS